MTLRVRQVETYLTQLQDTVAQLSVELINEVITILLEGARNARKVFVCGNGSSASTASHFACDLAKNTIVPGAPRFRVIALTNDVPLMAAWANNTVYDNIFAEQLRSLVEPSDIVIGISCSGNSVNVLNAVTVAKEHGATTIAFTGDNGGRLKELVDLAISVPSSRSEQQEDVHLILEHCICSVIRDELAQGAAFVPKDAYVLG